MMQHESHMSILIDLEGWKSSAQLNFDGNRGLDFDENRRLNFDFSCQFPSELGLIGTTDQSHWMKNLSCAFEIWRLPGLQCYYRQNYGWASPGIPCMSQGVFRELCDNGINFDRLLEGSIGRRYIACQFCHEMQLEPLCGNRAFFLKCNYRGTRWRTWENSEELRRSAWICGDLWGSVGSCGELTPWKFLVSNRLRIKSKENAWTCNVPISDFRIAFFFGRCFPMASHRNQMASNRLTGGHCPMSS